MPSAAAAWVRSSSASLRDSCTNAVLHECWKPCGNVGEPRVSPSKLRNDRPSTVTDAGQLTGAVSATRPRPSSAEVEATLNADPGGKWPVRARLKPNAGRFAEARIWPVATSTATRPDGTSPLPTKAFSAAACTRGSRVSVTSVPGAPG